MVDEIEREAQIEDRETINQAVLVSDIQQIAYEVEQGRIKYAKKAAYRVLKTLKEMGDK